MLQSDHDRPLLSGERYLVVVSYLVNERWLDVCRDFKGADKDMGKISSDSVDINS